MLHSLTHLSSVSAFSLDPKAEFFYFSGRLIKIYGCFSAKPENCSEGIFQFTKFMANFRLSRKKLQHKLLAVTLY